MDQAEQLRNVIKEKTIYNSSNTEARLITVTSGKGGVGKSNISVNLAVQLSKLGKKVIIFDADFGLANIEVMFGAIPQYNLSDLIYHGKNIKEIITPGPLDIGFISGGSGILGLNNLKRDQILYLAQSINELNELADYIIIDTGVGISDQVLEFILSSPEIILVTTPDPTSLTDSYSLLKALYNHPAFLSNGTVINVIANRVISYDDAKIAYDKLNSCVGQFLHGELKYFGMIPNDVALEKAVRQQKPVSLSEPYSNSAKAFEIMAYNLVNGTNNQLQIRRGITHLFANLLNKLG